MRTYTSPGGMETSSDAYLRGYFSGEVAGVTNVPEEYKQDFLGSLDAIKNDAIGNLVWNARTSVAGEVGAIGQNPNTIKEDISNRIADTLMLNPQLVVKILGLNYSPARFTEAERQNVKTVVDSYVEELIPDEFIYRLQVRKNLPILFGAGS